MRLESKAKALGVTHMATGQSTVDWSTLLSKVQGKLTSISRLPLSMFGRAFAANGYAHSKLLYAAEFVGLPPACVLTAIKRDVGHLVDKGWAPQANGRRSGFTGVAAKMQVGHPREGGCGVMPLEQHILSRHVMWAVRLITAKPDIPWVHVARHLVNAGLTQHPMSAQLGIGIGPAVQLQTRAGARLPPPLLRLASALQALPPWQDVQPVPLAPGTWVVNAPLWGNPFAAQQPEQPLPRQGLEAAFPALAAVSTLRTLWDLREVILLAHGVRCADEYRQQVWPLHLASRPELQDWATAKQQLLALANSLPSSWRPFVVGNGITAEALLAAPSMEAVVTQLVGRLGWSMPSGKPMTLYKATVRGCTQLQMVSQQALTMARMHRFREALVVEAPAPVSHEDVLTMLSRMWALPWDNQRKELLWRLVLNGLPTAARMDMTGEACQCGAMAPGCRHHFWECPAAVAVRNVLEQHLECGVRCDHVWMTRVPREGLHTGVWRVVALAALLGMDKARRALCRWRLSAEHGHGQQQQHQGHEQPPPPVDMQVSIAAKVAVATFWDMLNDFVAMRKDPPTWRQALPRNHPLIGPSLARDALVVRRLQQQ
jgi:hypothetical protein